MKINRRILMLFAAFLLSAVSFTACINSFALAEAEPASEPFSAGFELCGVHYPIDAEEIDLSSASEINIFGIQGHRFSVKAETVGKMPPGKSLLKAGYRIPGKR